MVKTKNGLPWAQKVQNSIRSIGPAPPVRLKNAASTLPAPRRRVATSLFDERVDVRLARALENCPRQGADGALIGRDPVDDLAVV